MAAKRSAAETVAEFSVFVINLDKLKTFSLIGLIYH